MRNFLFKKKGERNFRSPFLYCSKARRRLIAIVLRFVGAFDGDAEVVGLFLREFGEFHADLFEVQTVQIHGKLWPQRRRALSAFALLRRNERATSQ
ncbi:MAG TPA: hypothetical protein VNU95_09645, partial [Candidatus Acidoferrales bacterium]|nr:hypothetical protein [Candidatus Acidoferrales bacterium]